jgi:hypothetical protein
MSKVVFDISMSLDGFMTASGQRPDVEHLRDEHIDPEIVDVLATDAATHFRFRVLSR